MPIQYTGVLEEHRACREHAVVFDVSHLGSVRVAGRRRVRRRCSGRSPTTSVASNRGAAQYTHLLDPDDAHVVDDIIVWWVAPDEFLVMPNASNTDAIVAALAGPTRRVTASRSCHRRRHAERAVLAVQGPRARALLAAVRPRLPRSPRFAVRPSTWHGADCVRRRAPATPARTASSCTCPSRCGRVGVATRSGRRDHARRARRPRHAAPRGRAAAARPRARAGHHAAAGRPRLGRALGQGRRSAGRDAARRRARAGRRRGGCGACWPRVARSRRAGCAVADRRRRPVGEVTSGNFSPVLEQGIALAFLPPDVDRRRGRDDRRARSQRRRPPSSRRRSSKH